MRKLLLPPFLFLSLLLLSGCDLSGSGAGASGGVLKTVDGGKTWEPKVKIDNEKNISSEEILSMEINPADTQIIYIGTQKKGIFMTKNGGDSWNQLNFPPTRVYGLAINPQNSQIIYASGVWNKRGKIYKSKDGGEKWEEIYTEPGDGTVVTSLVIGKSNPEVLYAGTSEGMIFKTENGGNAWKNLYKAGGPVTGISFDFLNENYLYFLIYEKGILMTKDGGLNLEDLSEKINKSVLNSSAYSLTADPNNSGVVYVGLDKGIAKGTEFGEKWSALNILESSKKFPIRAIAINPKNSNEIMYSIAKAIYKSGDGGVQWSTFQLAQGVVSIIKYDILEPSNVYAGLRVFK